MIIGFTVDCGPRPSVASCGFIPQAGLWTNIIAEGLTMEPRRLFIALDLSDAARENICRVCAGIKNVRWTRREQLHLTLRFIGDTETEKIPVLTNALSGLAFSPFKLTLSGTGFFRPNIFFLSLDESAELFELKQRLDVMLSETLGLPPETRRFIPHITLSRLSRSLPPAKIKALHHSFSLLFPESFKVDKITLYASNLTPDGAVHTPVKTVSSR